MADPGVAGVVPLSVPLSHACVLVDCVAEKPTLARRLAFRRFSPRFRAGSPVWVDVNKRGRCATLCFRTCPRGCASGRPPPFSLSPFFLLSLLAPRMLHCEGSAGNGSFFGYFLFTPSARCYCSLPFA